MWPNADKLRTLAAAKTIQHNMALWLLEPGGIGRANENAQFFQQHICPVSPRDRKEEKKRTKE
jgi:hypothetical protein